MIKIKYAISKLVCPLLPPIISQRFRSTLLTMKDGETLDSDFSKRSFTGGTFHGNTADFHAFKFSVHGYFDWRNIIVANETLKSNPGDIIEVGANIGTETISFADIARKANKKVYAFEPLASNYELLAKNIALNTAKNVALFQCLVADAPGKSFFKIPAASDSGSGYITDATDEGVTEVAVVTLDDTLKKQVISLIAIDVEGFEYQVLQGASTILAKDRPVVIVEVNRNYLEKRAGITLQQFCDFFVSNDYTCYYINKLGLELVSIEDFKVKPNKNWVCIPKSRSKLASSISTAIKINALNPLFNYYYF